MALPSPKSQVQLLMVPEVLTELSIKGLVSPLHAALLLKEATGASNANTLMETELVSVELPQDATN